MCCCKEISQDSWDYKKYLEDFQGFSMISKKFLSLMYGVHFTHAFNFWMWVTKHTRH